VLRGASQLIREQKPSMFLSGHPKAANDGHLKTGQ
jgi:hypothetical protein